MQKIIGTILMIVIGLSFNKRTDNVAADQVSNRETVEVLSNLGGEVRMVGENVF